MPEPFRAVTSTAPKGIPDHRTNQIRAASLSGRLARAARRAAINGTALRPSQTRGCALVYTWGKILLWPHNPPFVVELDNPYVLALYGQVGAARRALLRRLLLAAGCAGIVCISEACRTSTARVFGEDVAQRAEVVYPFIERRRQAQPGAGRTLQVVFVGTQFWLKGGFELCDAFASVAPDYPHVRLTVISNVDPDVRAHFADTPIEFVAARLPRSEIADILATADLFAMPTLVESFGMAALEALAHGLPILTTCVYALPELVQDGVNGVLLSDSFGYWRGVEANPEIWRAPDLEECVRGRRFPALRDELTAALGRMLANREALRAMGGASRSLFDTRFAPEVRQRRFRAALEKFAARAGER